MYLSAQHGAAPDQRNDIMTVKALAAITASAKPACKLVSTFDANRWAELVRIQKRNG